MRMEESSPPALSLKETPSPVPQVSSNETPPPPQTSAIPAPQVSSNETPPQTSSNITDESFYGKYGAYIDPSRKNKNEKQKSSERLVQKFGPSQKYENILSILADNM